MNVLGIETSCDETSAAVVRDGRHIISCEVSSSLKLHKIYGGVIPEIASRAQLETISAVAEHSLKKAKVSLAKIGLISVAAEPGLPGSLLVGTSFARALGLARGIPLVAVDHVLSHIYANFLDSGGVKLPFAALVVSGGHTNLFLVRAFDDIKLVGRSLDDACGEAFDKTAKILRLGYPGGPEIEKAAKKGNAARVRFNCSVTDRPLDFSFSGIKTAVLYYIRKNAAHAGSGGARQMTYDIAASFQEAVIAALVDKSLLACVRHKIRRLAVGGGVAANGRLREKFLEQCRGRGLECYFPAKQLCTDNAAMVAGFGYQLYKKGRGCDQRS